MGSLYTARLIQLRTKLSSFLGIEEVALIVDDEFRQLPNLSNDSAQIHLIDIWFTCSIPKHYTYVYIATPLDRNFSFSMRVAQP